MRESCPSDRGGSRPSQVAGAWSTALRSRRGAELPSCPAEACAHAPSVFGAWSPLKKPQPSGFACEMCWHRDPVHGAVTAVCACPACCSEGSGACDHRAAAQQSGASGRWPPARLEKAPPDNHGAYEPSNEEQQAPGEPASEGAAMIGGTLLALPGIEGPHASSLPAV